MLVCIRDDYENSELVMDAFESREKFVKCPVNDNCVFEVGKNHITIKRKIDKYGVYLCGTSKRKTATIHYHLKFCESIKMLIAEIHL